MNNPQPTNSKAPILDNMQYIIALALHSLCFIFWFIPVINVNALVTSVGLTLSEYYKLSDVAIVSTIYIILAIVGTILLALPIVMKGKFINRWLLEIAQAAPAFQLVLVVFCVVDATTSSNGLASIAFGGIVSILAIVAFVIWASKMLKKLKAANKNTTTKQ